MLTKTISKLGGGAPTTKTGDSNSDALKAAAERAKAALGEADKAMSVSDRIMAREAERRQRAYDQRMASTQGISRETGAKLGGGGGCVC